MVEYISHMGTDDTICDSARVSFSKLAEQYTKEENNRLILYLAKHNHWSPFSHAIISMRFTAPIFVARQLAKHQVGFAWNEESRRYIKTKPTIFYPESLRAAPNGSIKQGSGEELSRQDLLDEIASLSSSCLTLYDKLLEQGVCPEQARMVLPLCTNTTWIWTGSLYAWSRMFNLRIDPHSQVETQKYAQFVDKIIQPLFPTSWKALTNGR